MPKMKSRSGMAKRFKLTGSGKLKRNRAFKNHILEHKSPKQKRQLRRSTLVSAGDMRRIKHLLSTFKK